MSTPRDPRTPGSRIEDDPEMDDERYAEELAGPGRVVLSGPEVNGAPDLSTRYLGLDLRAPLVASASPLTGHLSSLLELDAAGVGAVVMPSLFEEDLDVEAGRIERAHRTGAEANAEAPSGYRPGVEDYADGAQRYLQVLAAAKERLHVPVIASLNGVTSGGWTRYATMLADAGADAIECNVYRVAADPGVSGQQVEDETLRLVESVVEAAGVPVAVKLSPFWSSLGSLAHRMADAGAAGLVLFNRFYQPDIDLDRLTVAPRLVLSTSHELRLPLRWMALLRDELRISLAASTGVHTFEDVAKVLLAGADVAMTTSALLRHGPRQASYILGDLESWLSDRGYASTDELRGAVSHPTADLSAFERAQYVEELTRHSADYVP